MKFTLVTSLLLVLVITAIACSKPAVDEGDNRPRLSIDKITTSNFGSSRENPAFPLTVAFDVRLRNDGRVPALLDNIVPGIDLTSGDCDLRLLNNKTTGLARAIAPGQVENLYIGAVVQSPCKGSVILKLTVDYSNLETKVPYTQHLGASTQLSFVLP